MAYVITATQPVRFRAKRKWTYRPTRVGDDELDDAAIAAIKADPKLMLDRVEDGAEPGAPSRIERIVEAIGRLAPDQIGADGVANLAPLRKAAGLKDITADERDEAMEMLRARAAD